MATLTAMQGLWSVIESMHLTKSNRKWLADKLIMPAPAKAETYSKEDQEILDGFREAVRELKDIKAGRVQLRSMDEFLAEVKQKEEAGYYD